jgi:GrpB-like predicted nucleotidyltransferase (UPF0157 family)
MAKKQITSAISIAQAKAIIDFIDTPITDELPTSLELERLSCTSYERQITKNISSSSSNEYLDDHSAIT